MSTTHSVNLFSSEHNTNPYPNYAYLRQNQPIYWASDGNGFDFWVITQYEDVQAVLKDNRFVKDFRNAWSQEKVAQMLQQMNSMEFRVFNQNMLSSDPPNHTRLRSLVSKAFTPRRTEELRPRIEAIAEELLADMDGQKEVDFIDSYAFLLPIKVIAELLGISLADQDKFRRWSNTMIDGTGPHENRIDNVREASQNFLQYLRQLVIEKRENPADDLTSALIQAEEQGEKLSEEELLAMLWLLIIAGHETTVNLIANGVLALTQNPDQMAKLKSNPELIKPAIEEFLRYEGPVETSTFRFASQDVEVHGQPIAKGDRVLVVLGSAARDAQQVKNPDDLDITREMNPHMAFGYGIHYCLGAPLARLEGQIAIGKLLARYPNIKLAVKPEELQWRPTLLLRSLKHMPVVLE